MPNRLERRYGQGHLHFITFSCYRRLPLLRTVRARNLFVQVLGETRARYGFAIVGYVVMPEHIHLLVGEPRIGTPSIVLEVLKQRVSRQMRRPRRATKSSAQLRLWKDDPITHAPHFWQPRFYDFNVWSRKKRNEKLHYMHFNPVQRRLVRHPRHWPWSSYAFYAEDGPVLLVLEPVG
ncbi:MAG TPA: transposase [Candidatus Acidoferrales bacterium]|nr:transposase [Candidatus Acidoferrales bacterium]